MTTKLLRQIHEQDQEALAAHHNGDTRQPKRVWAVEALKPKLSQEEYEAGQRAVRECILFFPGAKANMDRVDMDWSDAGVANKVDAGHNFWGLRRAVERRCNTSVTGGHWSEDFVEWTVQLWTLSEMAEARGVFRFTGTPRRSVPDTRPIVPLLRIVLTHMADYYASCDRGVESWRGRAA